MNCTETIRNLSVYLDGELDDATALAMAEHLSTCARCTKALQHRRRTARLVKRAMAPEPVTEHERRFLRESLALADEVRPVSPTRRRTWRFAVPAAAAAMLAVTLAALFVPGVFHAPDRSEKYVYHINNSDNAATALQNIQFHLRASPKAKFVVVTHNEGVDFLLRDAKDRTGRTFEPKIRELVGQGVQFRVCMNTLRVRNIPAARVVTQAQFVPSGIAEVGRLQIEEGFAYLKP